MYRKCYFMKLKDNRYWDKLIRLGVSFFEMKILTRLSEDGTPVPIRLVASNPTGYVLRIESYVEVDEGGITVFRGVGREGGDLEGKDVS